MDAKAGLDSSFQITPLDWKDLPEVQSFTDFAIGKGYYSMPELEEVWQRSQDDNKVMYSLVLRMQGKIRGVRITYPPGKWQHGKGKGLTPEQWPHAKTATAYFQSLFIDPTLTGKSFGKILSLAAIEILRSNKALGIVCHSWVESPNDSSGRYLRSLGFEVIATHPRYWFEVDYICTRCGKPCVCTAEEMYLDLTSSPLTSHAQRK